MGRIPEDKRMEEAFRDPAVPDGAHSIGDFVGSGGPGEALGGGDGTPPAQTYSAMCQDCAGDGVSGGWHGPVRKSRDEAQGDADAHNQSHENHTAIVV
jgi:hypothetical protein